MRYGIAHQSGYRVEAVEQKMRLDLPAQSLELRLRKAFVEARRFGLRESQARLRSHYAADGEDRPIQNQRGERAVREAVEHRRAETGTGRQIGVMSYSAAMQMGGARVFDDVFVNRVAYDGFVRPGRWPDHTTIVLEHRQAQGKGSINVAGDFQTALIDAEVHRKDSARGGWSFFAFGPGDTSSIKIPAAASCYACHAAHGAVDTTFVQFYPMLLPIGHRKGDAHRAAAPRIPAALIGTVRTAVR